MTLLVSFVAMQSVFRAVTAQLTVGLMVTPRLRPRRPSPLVLLGAQRETVSVGQVPGQSLRDL